MPERYFKTPKTKIAIAILRGVRDGMTMDDISYCVDDVECYLREAQDVLKQLVDAGVLKMKVCF